MCFFACQSATFSFADGGGSFHHKKYPKLTRRALSKNNVNHISLFSHTRTHIIHAKRRTVVVVDLLFFFCYHTHLKKNGEIIGNVPLGRANAVWIGLLGWGKFVLVHVVVFAFEREEYESECW